MCSQQGVVGHKTALLVQLKVCRVQLLLCCRFQKLGRFGSLQKGSVWEENLRCTCESRGKISMAPVRRA